MAIDWGEVSDKYDKGFKDYAKPGFYKAKVDGVEFKKVGAKGNYIMKLHLEETENVQYPTIDHFFSKTNDNWRFFHSKCLFQALGATEEKAKKGVEMAEESGDYEKAIKTYERGFKALIASKPEIEIEIFQDGKYTRADFNSSVAMPHDDAIDRTGDMILEDSEVIPSADDLNLPF